MKHYSHIFRAVALLLACFAGEVSGAWADEITYVFKSKSWTATVDGAEANWTSVKDGGGFYNYGIQVTKTDKSASAISPRSFENISEIVATYNTNKSSGTGTISIKIGSNKAVKNNVAYSSGDGSISNYTSTFTYNTPQSGNIEVTVSTTTNSIYLVSLKIIYAPTPSSPLASIALSGTYPTVFTEGSAFSHDGMTVTATYEDASRKDVTSGATYSGYDMSTPGSQTVTVSYTESEVTKTATYGIVVNALPTHTVTWSINGSTTEKTYKEGAAITFPADPEDIGGKVFVGWAETIIAGTTDAAPSFVASATMGDSDKTFYAVFADVTKGDLATVTDNLTASLINQSMYGSWSGKSDQSSAVYAGNSATSNSNELQIRASDDSGIVATLSGGNVRKIALVWGDVDKGRTLDVYGKNTAYSSAADLYGSSSKQGTKLGSIVCGTSTELQVTGDYSYIGLRANSYSMWFEKISITWEKGTADTYSNYCTHIASSCSVTITPAKYATFSAPYAVDFSATGITPYKAKASGSVVRLTAVPGGIVPAGTGVILYKDVTEQETVSVPVTETTASLTDNELVATLSRTLVAREGGAGYNYILQSDGAGGIVFNMATAEGAYMPAGRAYLSTTVDASAQASRLSVRFEDVTTGVGAMAPGSGMTHGCTAVYSLQGQRCSPRARGIYIKGGKKHVVR